MNQPLGNAVGNAIEVKEAITTLQGGGPSDFREHCLEVAGHILNLGGKTTGEQEGRRMAEQALTGGRGWEMFKRLVKAQGGDVTYVEDPALLPAARLVESVPAPRSGYLSGINARIVGQTAVLLGGGRAKKGDPIDHAVGVIVHHKVGDRVDEGESLFTLHANDSKRLEDARQRLLEAHTWSDQPVQPLPLFYGVVKGQLIA
jgi:pyrimidine-nucleoside phosphorylase